MLNLEHETGSESGRAKPRKLKLNYYKLHSTLGNKYAGYSQIYLIFPAFNNPSSECDPIRASCSVSASGFLQLSSELTVCIP